ncbi:similar to protein kinase [Botrytis cinerea T4]|uniref:Similar to protein kinase n=1 Tax=Botryotinia fuckeliana (strain T4) TaxID=999810 RepID=G2YB74_BOTF4|nr:similar to protein kinase [Botrytis cinerea T4]
MKQYMVQGILHKFVLHVWVRITSWIRSWGRNGIYLNTVVPPEKMGAIIQEHYLNSRVRPNNLTKRIFSGFKDS